MPIFVDNIEKITLENNNFRKVLSTNEHSQLVVMNLKPNEEIGMEVHEKVDQFFRIEAGQGKVIANDQEYEISDGYAIVIPAGTNHNVINTSETEDLKLYTIYSPANHPDGTINVTKADAELYEQSQHQQE
ncbi:MAG TPA: cupin domain-containing protein [bacterium]|jgi:mannose-6-phosphate isomerase-like protein (cupin superfamily)|nr:cupin domain-containing protein [bacterium]